jgi:hypothetical protein
MFARHELELRGELGLLDRIDANGRRVADQEPLLIDRELVAAPRPPCATKSATDFSNRACRSSRRGCARHRDDIFAGLGHPRN